MPYLPGKQATQNVASIAAMSGLYHPRPHTLQLADPVGTLYLPVLQRSQGIPSALPLKPRLHVQSSNLALNKGELVPRGHAMHPVAAAILSLYLPGWHATHSDVPFLAL